MRKETSDFAIKISFVILAIAVIYILILRHPNFINWLKGLGSMAGAVRAGAVVTGANIYQTTGNSCPNTCSGDCGGTNSVRNEHDNCEYTNYEATAIIQYGTHGTCDLGTEFDVKLAGPVHDDGRCCWWLFAIDVDENDDGVGEGGFTTGGEGPHPDTGKSCKDGVITGVEGLGNVEGKTIGIKGVTWANEDGTRHFEGWVDRTGSGTSWEKAAEQNVVEWGAATDCTGKATESTSTIESDQQVLFRVDCTDAQWTESRVEEIMPNQLASGGTAPPPSTPPPTTTPPPEEEDGEEEEPEDGEEEDGEDGEEEEDGDEQATCNETTKQCRCPDGTEVNISPQPCSACTSFCSEGANLARVTAFAARRRMNRVMSRSFAGRSYRYDRYSPRSYGYGFTANKRHLRMSNL